MKTLVVYYSNTGSNKYLAAKIARTLQCDIEPIRPVLNTFPFQMFFSLIGTCPGIWSLKGRIEEYDHVILCGPIWMGRLVSPLRSFVVKYRNTIKTLSFVTCCGSTDAGKNDQFGYALVFAFLKGILGDKCVNCEAFPIAMTIPEEKQKDGSAIMKTRLSNENFTGKVQERFEKFIQTVMK